MSSDRPDPEPVPEPTPAEALLEAWPVLGRDERLALFRALPPDEAQGFFLSLGAADQSALILDIPSGERRLWMRLLAPDDAADLLSAAPPEEREGLIALLDEATKTEVRALLAYAEDAAGGLMSPRFARVRPGATVDEAIRYLRMQTNALETIYYIYVLDAEQRLLGVVSLRQLMGAPGGARVRDLMKTEVVSVRDDMDQESVARVFAREDLMALPVVDDQGRMQGIVTADDLVDVVLEEATEDIQKIGGMEALDAPYLRTPLLKMVKKRAGWLSALFIGEMLTATAMGHFEDEIARAVVLALFVPLIISSGGNSGSQATTLVIRAMALGEVKLGDVLRVIRRELPSGLLLGAILGSIGLLRIILWQTLFHAYGRHFLLVGLTVALSLVGVVTWGTMAGALLPFLLRALGFDPASASAPFVATLVDVSGLIIYFSVAALILQGTLL
jgi:magnesium transporter